MSLLHFVRRKNPHIYTLYCQTHKTMHLCSDPSTGYMGHHQLSIIQVSPFHSTNFWQVKGKCQYNLATVFEKEMPELD